MSYILGTNVDKGRKGNSTPVYLMQVTLYDGGDTTTDYYWSNKAITVESQSYEDKFSLNGLGKIQRSINLISGGGIGEVGGFSFKLKNAGSTFLSDTLFSSSIPDWANALIELRLTFDDSYLAYQSQTGNFTVGDTLTGSVSGATATILQDWDDGTTGVLRLGNISGTFQNGETITDEHTGSATSDDTIKEASWTDAKKLGKYYIEKVGFDAGDISFSAIDSWHKVHRKIGKIFKKTVFEFLPDRNVGIMAPVIYGDFIDDDIHGPGLAYYSYASYNRGNKQSYVRVYSVNDGTFGGGANGEIVIAGHDIESYGNLPGSNLVTFIDPLKFFSNISTNSSGASYSGGFYRMDTSDNNFGYAIDHHVIPQYYEKSATGITNEEYCIDETPDNYTEIAGGSSYVRYRIPKSRLENLKSGEDNSNWAVAVLWAGTTSGTMNNNFIVVTARLKDDSGTTIASETRNVKLGYDWDDTTRYMLALSGTVAVVGGSDTGTMDLMKDDYTYLEIELLYDDDGSYSGGIFKVRNLFVIGAQLQNAQDGEHFDLYMTVKGRMYGSWIDASGRTSSYSSGDLIEVPGGIVESILEDELDMDSSDIDTDAFDDLEAERSSWAFAGEMLESKESLDIIDQIAYEGCFGYIQKEDGTETVFDFDVSGTPELVTLSSIVRWKGNKPQIKISLSDVGGVRNRFFLHYKKNMATDKYEELLFVDHTDESTYDSDYTNLSSSAETYWNKCANVSGGAYYKYGLLKTWEYKANWIRDSATAELFLKTMIDWLTRQHWILEYETFLDSIDLEIGDQRRFSHAILPQGVQGTRKFILVKKELSPKENTIKLTWLDIGT